MERRATRISVVNPQQRTREAISERGRQDVCRKRRASGISAGIDAVERAAAREVERLTYWGGGCMISEPSCCAQLDPFQVSFGDVRS